MPSFLDAQVEVLEYWGSAGPGFPARVESKSGKVWEAVLHLAGGCANVFNCWDYAGSEGFNSCLPNSSYEIVTVPGQVCGVDRVVFRTLDVEAAKLLLAFATGATGPVNYEGRLLTSKYFLLIAAGWMPLDQISAPRSPELVELLDGRVGIGQFTDVVGLWRTKREGSLLELFRRLVRISPPVGAA